MVSTCNALIISILGMEIFKTVLLAKNERSTDLFSVIIEYDLLTLSNENFFIIFFPRRTVIRSSDGNYWRDSEQ